MIKFKNQNLNYEKLFVLMLAGFFLSSCNSYLGKKLTKKSADDIKVEELKDECDCIEALDIIANDYLDLIGNHDRKSIREMSDKDQEALEKKAEPIMIKWEKLMTIVMKNSE